MARKKQELNTACRCHYKTGATRDFKSIEEASAITGLSVLSIKIRCNKPRASGKDGMTFEWLDEYTKKVYMLKKSKKKGKNLEYTVINDLKDAGFDGCQRSATVDKRIDNNKIDIVDKLHTLPVNIQCKNTQITPNYFKIRDACSDKSKPFCLIWKKSATANSNSPGTVTFVPTEYFIQLLKLAYGNG